MTWTQHTFYISSYTYTSILEEMVTMVKINKKKRKILRWNKDSVNKKLWEEAINHWICIIYTVQYKCYLSVTVCVRLSMCRWSVTSIGSGWTERCGRRDGLPWWWGMLLPSKVECLGPSGGAGACISRPLPVWLAVEKRGKALNGRNEGNISTQNDPEFTQITSTTSIRQTFQKQLHILDKVKYKIEQ